MAADAIDAAREDIGGTSPTASPSIIPLVGAEGYHALVNQVDRLARQHGPAGVADAATCSTATARCPRALRARRGRPQRCSSRCHGAEEYLRVEVVYAATHEGALHLDDILARRTRISIETPAPRHRERRGGRPARRPDPRLGRRAGRQRGRRLPRPGRGRARVAEGARRLGGQRRAAQRARRPPHPGQQGARESLSAS